MDTSNILKGLNEAQTEFVTAPDGPVLCVAGAGSGKTTVLVRRVAWLVANGVSPRSILLLTFTRAAAAMMLSRARALDPRCAEVAGGTFHSVGSQIIRANAAALGLAENFSVMDGKDPDSVVKLCMDKVKFPDGVGAPRASTVHDIISFSYNTKCTIEQAVIRKAPKYLDMTGEIAAVEEAYIRYKLDNALLDFDDLLGYFAIMLESGEIAAALRERFDRVLVDEHQDSNPIQLDVLYGLAGHGVPNATVVGDPAQSIYGFRGSAPETMFDFQRRYPGCKLILLEENYRSTQSVLAVANAVDRAMTPRFERELRSGRGVRGERPVIVRCADYDHETDELCRRVLAARENGGTYGDHAVIVRSMSRARRVEAAFLARGIPYKVSGGIRIDEASHVKDMLSLARVVDNVRNEPAWTRLFKMVPKVGEKTARKMAEAAGAGGDAVHGVDLARRVAPKADLAPLREAVAQMSREDVGLPERFSFALDAFAPVLLGAYADEWDWRQKDCLVIADMSGSHPDLREFLTMVTVDHSVDKKGDVEAAAKDEEPPVTISTIHSAKGLEWKHVHVPSFVHGHLPSMYAEAEDDAAEELRAFYVLVSRPQDTLTFYRPVEDPVKRYMLPESPYEAIVAPYVRYESAAATGVPTGMRLGFQTPKIDLRARLLGQG